MGGWFLASHLNGNSAHGNGGRAEDRVPVLNRPWGVRILLVLMGTAAAFLAFASAMADGAKGKALAFWVVCASVSGLTATILPAWESFKRDRLAAAAIAEAESQAIQARAAMNSLLSPVLRVFLDMASATSRSERENLCGQALQATVTFAATLLGRPPGSGRMRACWFQLDEDILKPASQCYGRGREPRTIFRKGTKDGDQMFKILDEDICYFFEDLTKGQLPPGWDAAAVRDYRTFMVVPIVARKKYGILAVDSPEVGDLTREDEPLVRTFARFMATALALGSKNERTQVMK
jgi:hypothetical protein